MEENNNPSPPVSNLGISNSEVSNPSIETTPVSETPKPKSKFPLSATIGIIIFLLLAGGVAGFYAFKPQLMSLISKPTPTLTPSPTPTLSSENSDTCITNGDELNPAENVVNAINNHDMEALIKSFGGTDETDTKSTLTDVYSSASASLIKYNKGVRKVYDIRIDQATISITFPPKPARIMSWEFAISQSSGCWQVVSVVPIASESVR